MSKWDPNNYWDIEFNPKNNYGGISTLLNKLKVRKLSLEKSIETNQGKVLPKMLLNNLDKINKCINELEDELAIRINYYVHERRTRCKDSPTYLKAHGCKKPKKVNVKKYIV